MPEKLPPLTLTWEQFDALEEATDIMAMDHQYMDTLEDAVLYLAKKYIAEVGPNFEADWQET